jgi:hypothetical protein
LIEARNGMDTLTVYPDGTREPGISFPTANGFVARVVSAVAEDNIPDAERVCKILNAHFAEDESGYSKLPSHRTCSAQPCARPDRRP